MATIQKETTSQEIYNSVHPIYLNEKDAAHILTCSVHKLRKDRSLKRGIPYYVLQPHSIRYSLEEIHKYMGVHLILPD